MGEWKEYKLGDFMSVKGGKRLPKGINLISTPTSHPYIRVRDLGKKKRIELDSTYEYVDDVTQKSISRYIVNSGDIIISIVGTIGLVAVVGETLDRANLTENCVKLVDINGFDKDFLYYYLVSPFGRQEIEKGIVGAVQAKLPIKNIQSITIKAPSLHLQQQIASILSSLDDKIEVNRRINENLEAQAQALFKSWFVDFEPFKDGAFVESKLGMIPKGWRVESLSSIAEYRNGLAMQKYRPEEGEVGLPVLKIKELGQGIFDANCELCSPSRIGNKYIINDGDIIFSWSGTLMVKIWCGGKCGLNQHLFIVVPNGFPKWFVYLWTRHHLDNFIRIAKDKAVTMGHIKRGELDKSMVLIPSDKEINEINASMAPILQQIINSEIESRRLTSLRDTLLPRLMSGELNVEDIEKNL